MVEMSSECDYSTSASCMHGITPVNTHGTPLSSWTLNEEAKWDVPLRGLPKLALLCEFIASVRRVLRVHPLVVGCFVRALNRCGDYWPVPNHRQTYLVLQRTVVLSCRSAMSMPVAEDAPVVDMPPPIVAPPIGVGPALAQVSCALGLLYANRSHLAHTFNVAACTLHTAHLTSHSACCTLPSVSARAHVAFFHSQRSVFSRSSARKCPGR
jgi:hypothetical protein